MANTIPMRHPKNGLTKNGFYGFSWTTLFFGGFPALFRGDFITFLGLFSVLFVVGIITTGVGAFILMIAWAFMYNKHYTRKLIERGYRFNGSAEQNKAAASAIGVSVD